MTKANLERAIFLLSNQLKHVEFLLKVKSDR